MPVSASSTPATSRRQRSRTRARRRSPDGSGSLQDLDHVPIVASVTKQAGTATSPAEVPARLDGALRAARTPPRGPTFVDVPLDCWGPSDAAVGADVYWAGAEAEVHAFADATRVPVFANDMGRGVVPADDALAFSRARGMAFAEADVVIVAGTP